MLAVGLNLWRGGLAHSRGEWWRAPEYELDGVAPILASDFVRDRYMLNGRPVLASALFSRSGGAKWVVGPAGHAIRQ